MLQAIKLDSQQIEKLLDMTKVIYNGSFNNFQYIEKDQTIVCCYINGAQARKLHWYELLINHLVPSIYMFGLEEFCLNIEVFLQNRDSEHLVDIVYTRFENHIKNITT